MCHGTLVSLLQCKANVLLNHLLSVDCTKLSLNTYALNRKKGRSLPLNHKEQQGIKSLCTICS